jgi:hypothetical protein
MSQQIQHLNPAGLRVNPAFTNVIVATPLSLALVKRWARRLLTPLAPEEHATAIPPELDPRLASY